MIPRCRAWIEKEKEMVFVDDMAWDSGNFEYIGDGITYQYLPHEIKLMQSTGLMDSAGKEIFEGDILKVTDEHSWLEVVSFNENKAMFVSKEIKRKTDIPESPLYDLFNTDIFKIEIIGNIWEDGELLDIENTEEN